MAWGRKKSGALKPQELERAWHRALRAAVAGDWSAAESWLERIVETDTNDLDAYHALARLYREQGAVGRAIRMHQNLLLRDDLGKEGRAEALGELARDFEAGGYAERAVASYEERLDLQPRHAETLERLVLLLRDLQDFPRAGALLRRLRRQNRSRADELEGETLLMLARTRARDGDQSGARQALKRCLRRDKNSAEAHVLMGDLEAERGKTAKAIEAWKRATTAAPELGSTLYPKIDAGYAALGMS
jgi:lipopolysaccharide biosynthesis regulator YciM